MFLASTLKMDLIIIVTITVNNLSSSLKNIYGLTLCLFVYLFLLSFLIFSIFDLFFLAYFPKLQPLSTQFRD
jgi:hypothetical protein